MAQEQQVFSLSGSRRALDERWQPRLWLAALLTGAAGLAGAGFHRLELLGPDAAGSVGGITIGLLAVAATTQVTLGFYLGDRTRWIGIASGVVTAGLLPIAGSLPLFGIVWPGLALIGGLLLLYVRSRAQLSERTINQLSGWLLVIPALILMMLWVYFPAIYALWISLFKDFNYLGAAEFVGLENYRIALRDPRFLKSLVNTTWYVVGTVPLSIFLGMLTAILLNERIRGLSLYRVAYFLPYITALTAAAAVWRWIYNPNAGLLNWLLGLGDFRWLANPDGLFELILSPFGVELSGLVVGPSVALIAIMIMSVWHFLGYNVVIFLAGLQSIPKEYYEAARIDGTNWLQQVRHITWPLLAPTTFFVLIISLIGSLNVFTQILILTPEGGVLNDTLSVVMYLYFKGFRDFDFGYASALAFILFVITLLLTLLQRRLFNRLLGGEAETR